MSEAKDGGTARNKVEEDIERHVLSTTVKLSDGTTGQVFSRGGRNEFQVFLYNCHVCGVPNLPGERCLQTHISGRKHQMRLSQGVIDAEAFKAPMQNKNKIQMNIAPGEPVPPGFENEVKLVAEIQPTLDRNKEDHFIGLEYIMELTGGGGETSYHCILCDKRGDPRTILSHIVSYNHRLKYLEKHYPSCVRELGDYRFQKDARPVLTKIVGNICAAIEETHGRLAPSVHDKDEYERNRMKYLTDVINEKHFDEKTGPKFVKLVDKAKIIDMVRRSKISLNLRKRTSSPEAELRSRAERKSLDSVSSISSGSMKSRSRSPRPKRIRQRRSRSISRSPSRRSGEVGSRRGRMSDEPPKKSLPTPAELSRQANEIQEDRYKWEKYRCLVEKAVEDLNLVLKEHEKNPEKHPLYPDEWKKFWNRRYKELQQEKKDPAKHDFKPEWIKFWTHRMKELHEEDIDKRKKEIRAKVGLPLEEEKPPQKVEVIKISDSPDSMVMSRKRGSISPWSDEDGRKIRPSPRRSRPRSRSRTRSRSPSRRRSRSRSRRSRSHSPGRRSYSPHHRERYYERPVSVRYVAPPPDPYYNFEEWASYYGPHKTRPVFARAPAPSYTRAGPVEPEPAEEPETDEPLTVVSVLRLLTALEEHLGSLGPKCIDLLAKALALEKVKANSADEMLVNEDTCVFFETTKEKLKGQILAGVMESGKVKAVKKAIKNIAALVHTVSKKREEQQKANGVEKESSSKESDKKNDSKAASASGGGLDRSKISLKLAAELATQGREDISHSELEQLVLVFVGMLQRSKQTSEIVTVRDFLAEHEVRNVEGEDKIMVDIKKTIEDDFKEDINATSDANALESLTDSDLQTLLQNFKDLSPEEQHHLISYLKKLEATDPTRVEKLRKFVNLDGSGEKRKEPQDRRRSISPPTNRADVSMESTTKSSSTDKRNAPIYDSDDDDDDDDYNFDDVVKAASKNVKEKQMQDHLKVVQESLQQNPVMQIEDNGPTPAKAAAAAAVAPNLSGMTYTADTQALIANIMGSLQKNVSRTNQSATPTEAPDAVASVASMNSLPYYQQANSYDSNPYPAQGAPNNFYQGYGMQPGIFPAAAAMNPATQPIFPAAQQQPQQQQQNPWGNSNYGAKYY
ncbi:uncharacterized protein CG7065 isoform X2 [Phlebotomus papatasi]|uniref:uncharacterized protein CG7065 isoform X2 n=2 Tax=Phlebotomus papatasi TaxID=29031 RepID=UPI0024836582|nr:uncharacterized protein CG7065 isoform X2 [Phlebotomus papatasi]